MRRSRSSRRNARPASIPASAPVPRVRLGRVGTNPAPECHGGEAALRGGGDNARLPGAPAEALDDIEPDPTRVVGSIMSRRVKFLAGVLDIGSVDGCKRRLMMSYGDPSATSDNGPGGMPRSPPRLRAVRPGPRRRVLELRHVLDPL